MIYLLLENKLLFLDLFVNTEIGMLLYQVVVKYLLLLVSLISI